MTIDDACCVSTGLSDLDECKVCEGHKYDCIGYIPRIQGEMYEATRVDRVIEQYQRMKRRLKNGASSVLCLRK